MGCRRLTMQEYEDITSSNPDRIGYDTQADCQERSCCDSGCCRETLVLSRCNEPGGCSPSAFGLGPEWQNIAGSPSFCQMVRQRPKINGGCNQADFPPFTTCAQYQEICDPPPEWSPDEPPSCYQQCTSYEGVDLAPCDYGQLSPRGIIQWGIDGGGGCCSSGECPCYYGNCPTNGSCTPV